MPLPWKKAKRTRISQLVADHLHPPKRGGSLVVETGFPTSLIDLFVKNRDRLKKPSKKKRFEVIPDPISIPSRSSQPFVVPPSFESSYALGTPSSSPPPNSPPVPASSSTAATPSSSRPPNSRLILPRARGSASGSATPQRCSSSWFGDEIVLIQESGVVSDGEDGGGGEVVDRNRVFTAIFKMFFVVVLALGTKKFVVGITLSTFLLLFMEYAGKHLCRLLKPCVDAQKSIQCLVAGVLCFVGIKRDKLIIEENRKLKVPIAQEGSKPIVSDGSGLIEGHEITNPIQEIQIVQPDSNSGCSRLIEGHKINDLIQEIQNEQHSANLVPPTGEIQNVEYEFDLKGGEEKWVCEEMGKKEEFMEKQEAYTNDIVDIKSQRTHSGKIRSKIKKFVSKTLRSSKKKRWESRNESSSSNESSNVVIGEVKEHLEDEEPGLEHVDKSSSLSSEGSGKSSWLSSRGSGDQKDVDAICSSSEFSRADMEDSIVREEIGMKTKRSSSSGYLVLVVIVLVGLVGGRGLALALSLSWYLLLKSAGTRQRLVKN